MLGYSIGEIILNFYKVWILFFISYFILRRYLFLPILKVIDEREGYIEDIENRYSEVMAYAKKKLEDVEKEMLEVKKRAKELKVNAQREAEDEYNRLLSKVLAEVEKKKEDFNRSLASQLDQEKRRIASNIDKLANIIARKVLEG